LQNERTAEPVTFEDFRDLGDASYAKGDFEGAIAFYDRAITLHPNDYIAWNNRGNSLHNLGRYGEAIESYYKALALNTENYIAWSNRGNSLHNLGRNAEAIEFYDKAVTLNPEFYQAWNMRGISLEKLGRDVEAIESYDKAVALNPEYYKAWYNRGISLEKLGRDVEAIESYDKAVTLNPEYHQAWDNRGNSLANLGRYVEAIESHNKAVTLNPEYYLSWSNRASNICSFSRHQLSMPDLLSSIQAKSIAALSQPEPHIAALQEALPHMQAGSVNWALIHLSMGDAYLKHSRGKQNPFLYWRDAIRSYQAAYPILTGEDHLSVLQGLVRAYLAFEDIPAARNFQGQGQTLFEELLAAQAEQTKAAFFQKFVSFSQLEIDFLIGEHNPTAALEQAEFYKNRCLSWILEGWQEAPLKPNDIEKHHSRYSELQRLVAPTTAVVYWHLGVESLTTFLITHGEAEPLVLPFDRQKQAQQFKLWLGTYDSEYRSYAGKKPKAIKNLKEHPWRQSLAPQLSKLQEILNTRAICQELPDTVQNLILVPHRDLHRVPLQVLFPDHMTCTFLPSLQIGLQLQAKASPLALAPLLNVNDPQTDQSEMPFARIESAVIQRLVKESLELNSKQASLAAVSHELQKNYRAFHFTGHGAYNFRQPAESALGLADGLLSAKQIGQWDLSGYQLVCLAACETALTGKDGIPDEYVGLASAFLKAGANNVLSTLWPVDEIASAWMMIRFYQNLLVGSPPATALKLAQQWLQTVSYAQLADWIMQLSQLPDLPPIVAERLQARAKNTLKSEGTMEANQPTEYQHPYYWAAFTLTGWG
jgi:CHAT domain-containing protein/tetratricopeptide (TPR) repeat protein